MGEASLWGAVLGATCNDQGEQFWGWIVFPFVMLYSFYILAQLCDGHLTRALDLIVQRIKMSEDVAGATFLAMASSAPELFTSIIATFVLENPAGVGNILGSAVFNLLVIIGVVPIFAGTTLKIWWYPTVRDAIFYSIAIIEIFLVLIDGEVHWWEGLIMTLSYFMYALFFTQNAKLIEYLDLEVPPSGEETVPVPIVVCPEEAERNTSTKVGAGTGGTDSETGTTLPSAMQANKSNSKELPGRTEERTLTKTSQHSESSMTRLNSKNNFTLHGRDNSKNSSGHGNTHSYNTSKVHPVVPGEPQEPSIDGDKKPGEAAFVEDSQEGSMFWILEYEPIMKLVDKVMPESDDWLYTLFGLCCLWIGAFTYFAVDSSMRLGCLVNMPDLVMGLIFLAAGTSVPDAMGSIAVARDGMGDMAVANAVGSNTFDILLGLGLPWFLKGVISQEPIKFHDDGTLVMAIIMLSACLVGYLVMITANRWLLTRGLGLALLFTYSAVITWFLVYYYWVRELI